MSIQFEGEPCRCTPRNLRIVFDNFVLFVELDRLLYFLRGYFPHVLRIVDDTRASLHENQRVALSDLVFLVYLKQCASSFPIVAFLQVWLHRSGLPKQFRRIV